MEDYFSFHTNGFPSVAFQVSIISRTSNTSLAGGNWSKLLFFKEHSLLLLSDYFLLLIYIYIPPRKYILFFHAVVFSSPPKYKVKILLERTIEVGALMMYFLFFEQSIEVLSTPCPPKTAWKHVILLYSLITIFLGHELDFLDNYSQNIGF